jgi:hypothetical protein
LQDFLQQQKQQQKPTKKVASWLRKKCTDPYVTKLMGFFAAHYSRTATARGKAEQADIAAVHAREDAQSAVICSKEFGPDSTSMMLEQQQHNAMLEQQQHNAVVEAAKQANNLLTVTNHNNAATNNGIVTLSNVCIGSISGISGM